MRHGGDIYRNKVRLDLSVSLNPLPVPPVLSDAMQAGCAAAGAYPDPEQEALRSVLAAGMGVDPACVIAGNGASELLLAAVQAVNPAKALLVEPCFSGYRYVLDSLQGCQVREYRMREEEEFAPAERMLLTLTSDLDLILLADPGNPAGRNIDPALLRQILRVARDNGTAVILDQSFYLLSAQGRAGANNPAVLTGVFRNLIVVSSFTKVLGLPGIRMGAAVSSAENVERIRARLPEWNVSSVAEHVMRAGADLLWKSSFCEDAWEMIRTEKEYLVPALESLGCRVYPSDTHYLLFQSSGELYGPLLERGILIRDCSDFCGLSTGFYRIAVRDHAANEEFVENLKEVMHGH